MKAHARILNASTISGVPLDRWKIVHSQMIAKNEGQARIDKLRVIHLYEADYNGFLKIIWPHRAVHAATKHNTLNYAQGGGQKGRQANHIALQKEMKYQYARLRKTNFATMDNDAKGVLRQNYYATSDNRQWTLWSTEISSRPSSQSD